MKKKIAEQAAAISESTATRNYQEIILSRITPSVRNIGVIQLILQSGIDLAGVVPDEVLGEQ